MCAFPLPEEKDRAKRIFELDNFALKQTLGTGTFSRVRLAHHIVEGNYYALKILKKSEVIRLKQGDHVKSEIRLLSSMIQHPFIVTLVGHFQDENRIFLVQEFIQGGELFRLLKQLGRFSQSLVKLYAAEITLALGYLHYKNIVYRSIQPENIMLGSDGNIKLVSFSFAKLLDEDNNRTFTLCGTPEYLAPEVVRNDGRGYGIGVDWWALGIVVYEMILGHPPFYDNTPFGIYQRILSGEFAMPRQLDGSIKSLVRLLLRPDATRRVGSMVGGSGPVDVMGQPFFSGVDWDSMMNKQLVPPYSPMVNSSKDTSNFDGYPESDLDIAYPLNGEDRQLFEDLENF